MLSRREANGIGPTRVFRSALASPAGRQAQSENPYLAFAYRWWWLIVVGALLGALGGVLYQQLGPAPYQTTALIAASNQTDASDNFNAQPRQAWDVAANFASQARSGPVYEMVSRALDGRVTQSDLEIMANTKRLEIASPRGTSLISVKVIDTDPDFAMELANTFARVFVTRVNRQAEVSAAARKRDLEQEIETTRQGLSAAQLKQREQDLVKELQSNRGQLLQLQLQYQQELQRQIEMDILQGQGRGPQGVTTAEEQQARLEQIANASAAGRAQAVATVQGTIADINRQLAQVRAAQGELAEAASSDPAEQQQRLKELQQQQLALEQQLREQDFVRVQRTRQEQNEKDLNAQIQNQRNRFSQIQLQYQQEIQRAAEAEARLAAAASNASRKRRQELEEAAVVASEARDKALQVIVGQQRDVEKQISDLTAQLSQLRAQISQLPPEPEPLALLQQQRRLAELKQQQTEAQQELSQQGLGAKQIADRRTELQRREQDLMRQLQDQRNRLGQVQAAASQQQTAPQRSGPTQPTLTPEQQQLIEQRGDIQAQVRTQWLQVVSEQQRDVEKNIAQSSSDLEKVREALSKQPGGLDPVTTTAFSGAYATLLQSLTRDYVRLQLNADTRSPLLLYGEASEPLPITTLRRVLAMGVLAGLVIGLGLAYLLELLRQRRSRREMADGLVLPAGARVPARLSDDDLGDDGSVRRRLAAASKNRRRAIAGRGIS